MFKRINSASTKEDDDKKNINKVFYNCVKLNLWAARWDSASCQWMYSLDLATYLDCAVDKYLAAVCFFNIIFFLWKCILWNRHVCISRGLSNVSCDRQPTQTMSGKMFDLYAQWMKNSQLKSVYQTIICLYTPWTGVKYFECLNTLFFCSVSVELLDVRCVWNSVSFGLTHACDIETICISLSTLIHVSCVCCVTIK